MKNFKTGLFLIVFVGLIFGSGSVAAASFEVWNGAAWSQNGTSHLSGRTDLAYSGSTYPCNADFTLKVESGVATLTQTGFGGSGACAGFLSKGLPWIVSIGSADGSAGWGVTIGNAASLMTTAGGVNIFVAGVNISCPNLTGRATVNGKIINPTGLPPVGSALTFFGLLGPCAFRSNSKLSANPAIRIVP